jgi:tetratricopeptide (TPR) repeat protein
MLASFNDVLPRITERKKIYIHTDAIFFVAKTKLKEANILFVMNRKRAALMLIKEIVDLVPCFVDAWVSMAIIQETIGHYVEAPNFYIIVAYIQSKNVVLWHQLAIKAQANNMFAEAIECYNWILNWIDPHENISQKKAFILWKVGSYSYSVSVLEALLLANRLKQPDPTLLKNIARWYYILQKTNEAMRLLENAIANHPQISDSTIENVLTELYQHQALYDDGCSLLIDSDWLKPSENSMIKNRICTIISAGIVFVRLKNLKHSGNYFSLLWYLDVCDFGDLLIGASQNLFDLQLYEQCLDYLNPLCIHVAWSFPLILLKTGICCKRLGLCQCAQEFMDKIVERWVESSHSKSTSFFDLICFNSSLWTKTLINGVILKLQKKCIAVLNQLGYKKSWFQSFIHSIPSLAQIIFKFNFGPRSAITFYQKFQNFISNVLCSNIFYQLKWLRHNINWKRKDQNFHTLNYRYFVKKILLNSNVPSENAINLKRARYKLKESFTTEVFLNAKKLNHLKFMGKERKEKESQTDPLFSMADDSNLFWRDKETQEHRIISNFHYYGILLAVKKLKTKSSLWYVIQNIQSVSAKKVDINPLLKNSLQNFPSYSINLNIFLLEMVRCHPLKCKPLYHLRFSAYFINLCLGMVFSIQREYRTAFKEFLTAQQKYNENRSIIKCCSSSGSKYNRHQKFPGPSLFAIIKTTCLINWINVRKVVVSCLFWIKNYLQSNLKKDPVETYYNIGRYAHACGMIHVAAFYYCRSLRCCDNRDELERQVRQEIKELEVRERSAVIIRDLRRGCVHNFINIFDKKIQSSIFAMMLQKYSVANGK